MAHASFKKIFPLFLLLLTVTWPSRAQDDSNPVHWGTAVEKTGDGIYDIRFTARIDSPWHMYDMGPYDGGPNATAFTFTPNGNYTLVGKTRQESKPSKKFDPLFDMEIGTFAGRAVFVQQVKLVPPVGGARIAVNIEWMACDETSCLPPADRDFTVTIGDPSVKTAVPAPSAPASPSGNNNPGLSNLPSASTAGTTASATTPEESTPETTSGTTTANATTDTASAEINAATTEGGSLWSAIIEAILWGFAALLTPCVFPMVPMTVSFFLKGSENKARGRLMASLYGLCIILLYTLPIAVIILITRIVGGDTVTADIFNWLATHWIPNVIFFLVFMIFAASFFGAFEITMPSWLVNKSDSKADKGGIVGVFFMALTLVLVSFSCTGPIVGSVLIKSTSGEVWAPVITMFAFSAAFALPFTLFALFPSLLKNLPKSGGWLNSVKVVLGFLELALGLKFLSVADQTYHWGILDREIYLALWIVIFSLLGLYLLGKLRFAHDSETKTIGVPRLLLSIITFAFVVYMLPGMWGAPLKGLSGYLPPIHTQDFVTGSEAPAAASTPSLDLARPPKHSDFLSLPHGLQGFFDYDEAMAYARKVNKPLFVDYTGHGCVNCREMEARVWADPEVLTLLRNDFVIVALYSDDKKELPQDEWVTTETGKVLKSLGKINAHFAHKQFGINSQPYYMILNDEGKQLVPGRGYNLNIPEFVQFLKKGAEQFRTQHSAPETTNS
ncbi:protein-disulfide reductase DsbD family protein [Alistipes indistinctus]|jgi:thiol:disulfide interchange protein|uniref:protein-disulfide reductase DsbD family protein n=1 Tax=Alistipes indistinctus TaxID=626932 RepID=UPI00241D5811|nr:thioredoxin family protein [Alistipes indistinctus]